MHRLGVLTAALLLVVIVSIDAYRENEKVCLRNLLINGTNLITNYRKQILVVGISHLGCQACRNQAVRYNDLYRDLEYQQIRDPDVRLILINEQHAAQYLPGTYYGKIRLFQDNYRDRLIEKLGHYGERLNNLVFGRCGQLIYTQTYPLSNIEDETNYQQLLRTIVAAAKYKEICYSTCI